MVGRDIDSIYILSWAECVVGLTWHITALDILSVVILANQFEVFEVFRIILLRSHCCTYFYYGKVSLF